MHRGGHDEFLARAHSENYGKLDRSNWKDVGDPANTRRVDPAVRGLIKFLNDKGFTTFSCCSGGHRRDRRNGRHEEGYVAFSPPTRAVFKLYFSLQETQGRFDFTARLGINNEDQSTDQTVDSELRWLLKPNYYSKRRYYRDLFAEIIRIFKSIRPDSRTDSLLTPIFGMETGKARKILSEQQTRFIQRATSAKA